MPDNNSRNNQPNSTNFSSDPNISDKHIPFVNQANPSAVNPNQVQPQSTGNVNTLELQREQYINPNNFQKVLNQTAQPGVAQQQNQTQPANNLSPDGSIPPLPVQYSEKVMNPVAPKVAKKGNEVLKLVVYVVPVLAIFILLLKSIDDEDVLWHVRQSLLTQGVWFGVLIALNLVFGNAPIISTYGISLWNLIMFVSLILAGVQAYSHEKFHIPVIYEIGKSFIENEK
jgi:uncharacterized membrane protein